MLPDIVAEPIKVPVAEPNLNSIVPPVAPAAATSKRVTNSVKLTALNLIQVLFLIYPTFPPPERAALVSALAPEAWLNVSASIFSMV
ncbi:hypothetical protein D3C87_960360 [compost metagenome]